MAEGYYSGYGLATAVETALQTGSTLINGAITVAFDPITSTLSVATTAANGGRIKVYTEQELVDGTWNGVSGQPIDVTDTKSANKACGFMEGTLFASGPNTVPVEPAVVGAGNAVISSQQHHQLFVHSSLAQPGDSWGPLGQSDIIRRVVMDGAPNSLIADRHTTAYDQIRVQAHPLRSMRFSLRDVHGRLVDLRGHSWSFSLVFHDAL